MTQTNPLKTLIIAEAGVNHNGDISLARQLIDVAADVGAQAAETEAGTGLDQRPARGLDRRGRREGERGGGQGRAEAEGQGRATTAPRPTAPGGEEKTNPRGGKGI